MTRDLWKATTQRFFGAFIGFATVGALMLGTACAGEPTIPAACDGVTFNIPVGDGDPKDRDGDGIACER